MNIQNQLTNYGYDMNNFALDIGSTFGDAIFWSTLALITMIISSLNKKK